MVYAGMKAQKRIAFVIVVLPIRIVQLQIVLKDVLVTVYVIKIH